MAVFCLCLDNLSRAEFKSNELMCLAEEISLQQSTEPVAWLLLTPTQVNNEREKKKRENIQLSKERNMSKLKL